MQNNSATKDARSGKKLRNRLFIIWMALTISAGGIGVAAAKYVTEYRQEVQIHASEFHFSSDYLVYEKDAAEPVQVTDWQNGIVFHVYNYEVENTAQKSEMDVVYTVAAEGCTVTIDNKTPAFSVIPVDNTAGQRIVITPPADAKAGDKIEVSVTSKSPYTKTLKRTFVLAGVQKMTYTVNDMGNYAMVNVYTNGESGTITLGYDSDTHTLDTQTTSASMQVEPHTMYALILLENAEITSNSDHITVTLTKGG